MFESHLISMIVFAALVSLILGCLKFNEPKPIARYAAKYFLSLVGGVIVFAWIMRIL